MVKVPTSMNLVRAPAWVIRFALALTIVTAVVTTLAGSLYIAGGTTVLAAAFLVRLVHLKRRSGQFSRSARATLTMEEVKATPGYGCLLWLLMLLTFILLWHITTLLSP